MSDVTSPISFVYPPKKILVPTDGSTNANRALSLGIDLAKMFDAELVVLNVIPTPGLLISASSFGTPTTSLRLYYDEEEETASHITEEAVRMASKRGVSKVTSKITRAENSIVEEIITSAVNDKVDLIVIGTRGLGGFTRMLQGGVSRGVVTHARSNVLVVR